MTTNKTIGIYFIITVIALAPVMVFAATTAPLPPAKNTTAPANKNKPANPKPNPNPNPSANPKTPAPPEMWGVQLPMGARKIQIYRAAVSYRADIEPEETAKQLLTTLGSAGIKVYRSTVGSTVMIFIGSETPRAWSEIQISGVKGKAQSFITIAKTHGDVGWHWKRNGKNWDFQ